MITASLFFTVLCSIAATFRFSQLFLGKFVDMLFDLLLSRTELFILSYLQTLFRGISLSSRYSSKTTAKGLTEFTFYFSS